MDENKEEEYDNKFKEEIEKYEKYRLLQDNQIKRQQELERQQILEEKKNLEREREEVEQMKLNGIICITIEHFLKYKTKFTSRKIKQIKFHAPETNEIHTFNNVLYIRNILIGKRCNIKAALYYKKDENDNKVLTFRFRLSDIIKITYD